MTTVKSHARTHAKAKITVQSSEAKPYDQTAGPALMEIRLSETFTGDIEGETPVRALQVLRDDKSASLVSVQRFRGKLGGRQGTFVLQGQEVVENARSRRHGLSFPDRGRMICPDCAAKAALKATLGKGQTERWIIGSNDVATRNLNAPIPSGRIRPILGAPSSPKDRQPPMIRRKKTAKQPC